jgi:capsular exopolysaccharide synthesis family protein
MENLAQRIKEWEAKSLDLSQRLAEYQRLKSKLARQQMTFDNLSSSVQRVDLNKNMEQENVAVLEHATSASIIRVQLPRQLGLGIVIGALLGCGIIFLLNRLDDRMDSVVELQENFDVPIRGQIPRATINRQTDRVPLLMAKDNRHVFSESYRNIRSSLLFMGAGTKKPRSIVVTSAVPGEGKSTVAANLAITFAFSEAKTLLVDSDMRRGVLHDLFQIPSAPGLADYLQQEGNWRKSVRSTSIPTLSILPRGKVPANPGELLLGPPCDLFLREVVEEYEVVIIDSAPLLATDDTSSLAPKMDGVLFVSRARYSSIRSMRSALDLLTQRHVNLLGIIFNSVDPNLPGYYDYYRYKQYYAAVEET